MMTKNNNNNNGKKWYGIIQHGMIIKNALKVCIYNIRT